MDQRLPGFHRIAIEIHPAADGVQTVHEYVAFREHLLGLLRETAHMSLHIYLRIYAVDPFRKHKRLRSRVASAHLGAIDVLTIEIGDLRTIRIHYDEAMDSCNRESRGHIGAQPSASYKTDA